MSLQASVEIPWLSMDLQTSGSSAAPVLDTDGESGLLGRNSRFFLLGSSTGLSISILIKKGHHVWVGRYGTMIIP